MKNLKEAFESSINQHIPYMFEESSFKNIERELMFQRIEKIERKAHLLALIFFIFIFASIVTVYFLLAKVTILDVYTLELGLALSVFMIYCYCLFMNQKLHKS